MFRWIWVIPLLAAAAPPPGASSCSGCHGPSYPIAGRDAQELVNTLAGFGNGTRESTVMGRIVKGFDQEELTRIASWWPVQK